MGWGVFRKLEVRPGGVPHDDELWREVGDGHLGHHVIAGEHPLTALQSGELLQTVKPLHPVHARDVGQRHRAALDEVAAIGHDEELTTESEVLLRGGREVEHVAFVIIHVGSVRNIIMVEEDGIAANGTGEGVAQQLDVVLVDVHVAEVLLRHQVHEVACLKEVRNSGNVVCQLVVLARMWLAAVAPFRDCLFER